MNAILRCASAALLLLVLGASALPSQSPPRGTTVVALADSMPVAGAKVIVFFRAQPLGGHVILLPSSEATPEALGLGEAVLRRLDAEHSSDRHSAIVPVSGAVLTNGASASDRARWTRALTLLRARPATRIGDLGPGRWLELSSPVTALHR